ncbi:MAG: hypothetical protein B6I26_02995 [Desulfobacteraceae bacterium 4572_130]|nr:MAG: hypothetical protein B6I26_02995 [Desulfobacteraceae bacterium 4572_130]
MTGSPKEKSLKKAIQWISDKRKENPNQNLMTLVDNTSLKFDLTPEDSEFLIRFVKKYDNYIKI